MLENSARKPPTDFTIDCILSKPVNKDGETQKAPVINHPMNKVLANPWRSKCPLSLTYNPSSHRKLSFPPSAFIQNYLSLSNPLDQAENLVKVSPPLTQHFPSVHSHFYPAATASTSSEINKTSDKFKYSVYDTKVCDKKIIRNNISLSEDFIVKHEIPSPTTPNSVFKCSVCSKVFENNEILNVSLLMTV